MIFVKKFVLNADLGNFFLHYHVFGLDSEMYSTPLSLQLRNQENIDDVQSASKYSVTITEGQEATWWASGNAKQSSK